MTAQDIERQIALLQQQYTQEENELLRLRPRAKHLKQTLAQLNGAIAMLQGLLKAEQQAAQTPVLAPDGAGSAKAPQPAVLD